jgi:hypothetical protein
MSEEVVHWSTRFFEFDIVRLSLGLSREVLDYEERRPSSMNALAARSIVGNQN